MVSSYLICDVCGRFGPPAGFLKEDGLRLCYQCWFQEWQENHPSSAKPEMESEATPKMDGATFDRPNED